MAVVSSVLDLIGNTPLVDVSALSPNPDVRILAKLESQNPAGSVKDRIAAKMIEEAEADGTLTPGRTIIEPSNPQPAGRTLDFLSQEMLREANTIASKSADVEISRRIVEIKTAIDRIKEQAQNAE